MRYSPLLISSLISNFLKNSCLIILVGLLAACGTSRKATVIEPGKKPSLSVIDKLRDQRPEYSTFEGKTRLKIDSEELKVGLNATIRMEKGKSIWAVVSKFGFEAGRMLVTPDSAFIIDRLNKVYYAENLEDYRREYSIPFGFDAMQDLFLGIPVMLESRREEVVFQEPHWVFVLKDDTGYTGEYTLDNRVGDPRVLLFNIIDPSSRIFRSGYGDFRDCGPCKSDIAYTREHQFTENGEVRKMSLEFSEISFDNNISMPFEIPDHYEREHD